jgi:WD40 repeat protein
MLMKTKYVAIAALVGGLALLLILAPQIWLRRSPVGASGVSSAAVTELTGIIGARYHSGRLAFSADSKSIALPKSSGGRVEIWSLETGLARVLDNPFQTRHAGAFEAVFSRNGRWLAVAYGMPAWVTLWDLATNRTGAQLPLTKHCWVHDMAFIDKDQSLLMAIHLPRDMPTIKAFFKSLNNGINEDLKNASIPSYQDNINNIKEEMAISSKGAHVMVIRWEFPAARLADVHVFEFPLEFKALSADGRYAVLEDTTGSSVFDTATGKKVFATEGKGGFVFADNGSALASYNGRQVYLMDVPSGQVRSHFRFESSLFPENNTSSLDQISLSPDMKQLAVGGFSESHMVGIMSLETGRVIAKIECCPSSMFCDVVRFSPDGRILVTNTATADAHDRVVEPLLRFWKISTPTKKPLP